MRSIDLSIKLQADAKKLLLVRAGFHRYVQESGAFRLVQRPKTVQRSTAAAELRGWQREEDEEKETKGIKGNEPSVLFIRAGDKCQARKSRGREFGSEVQLLPRLSETH